MICIYVGERSQHLMGINEDETDTQAPQHPRQQTCSLTKLLEVSYAYLYVCTCIPYIR